MSKHKLIYILLKCIQMTFVQNHFYNSKCQDTTDVWSFAHNPYWLTTQYSSTSTYSFCTTCIKSHLLQIWTIVILPSQTKAESESRDGMFISLMVIFFINWKITGYKIWIDKTFNQQVTIQCHNCCDMWDSQGRIISTCWYWMTTKSIGNLIDLILFIIFHILIQIFVSLVTVHN